MTMHPLDDPAHVPLNPPVDGQIPDVVSRFGPATQIRYFRRFWDDLGVLTEERLRDYYCHSIEHRGACCSSCIADEWDGYDYGGSGCCCRSTRQEA